MTTAKILLNTIESVKDFVNIVSKFDAAMDLSSGRYIVDAKSIMGIFSMNLSRSMELCIHDDGAEAGEVLAQLQGYLIKE